MRAKIAAPRSAPWPAFRRSPSRLLPAQRSLSSASPVHPDAALFAMQSAIEAADRELDDALDAARGGHIPTSTRSRTGRRSPWPGFSAEEQRALDALAAEMRRDAGGVAGMGGLLPSGSRLRAGNRTPESRVRRNCRS